MKEWIPRHPGGTEALLLAAGRDCTNLFESYHPFTDKPREILSKYKIGVVENYEHPVFLPDNGFYAECCKRVGDYFRSNNINPKNPLGGVIRMMFVIPLFFISFCLVFGVIPNVPMWAKVPAAIIMGVTQVSFVKPLLYSFFKYYFIK